MSKLEPTVLSLRRRIGNWISIHIPVIGPIINKTFFHTKEERAQLAKMCEDLIATFQRHEKFFLESLEKHPELKPWFTDERIRLLPGGQLLAIDAVCNFESIVGIARLAPFLNAFARNDAVYIKLLIYFAQLPGEMIKIGYITEDNVIVQDYVEAATQLVYHEVTEIIVRSSDGASTYPHIRRQLPEYL